MSHDFLYNRHVNYYKNIKHSNETSGFSSDSPITGNGVTLASSLVVFFNLTLNLFSGGIRLPEFLTEEEEEVVFRICPAACFVSSRILTLRGAGDSLRTTLDGTTFR